MGSREIRRVPGDWEHPKKPDHASLPDFFCPYVSLFDGTNYSTDLEEWRESKAQWDQGKVIDSRVEGKTLVAFWRDATQEEKNGNFEEDYGRQPALEGYMPVWTEAEATHYQMYETISEGTPVSPVMPTIKALMDWLQHQETAPLHVTAFSPPAPR